jgi:hypothetical protein
MDKLQELEGKWGKGRVLDFTIDGIDLFFHAPTQGDHERYVEKLQGDASKTIALREYVFSCMAEEGEEAVARYRSTFERFPAAPDFIGTELVRAAKGGIQRREKKSVSSSPAPSGT